MRFFLKLCLLHEGISGCLVLFLLFSMVRCLLQVLCLSALIMGLHLLYAPDSAELGGLAAPFADNAFKESQLAPFQQPTLNAVCG
jgi:hypothetical protein